MIPSTTRAASRVCYTRSCNYKLSGRSYPAIITFADRSFVAFQDSSRWFSSSNHPRSSKRNKPRQLDPDLDFYESRMKAYEHGKGKDRFRNERDRDDQRLSLVRPMPKSARREVNHFQNDRAYPSQGGRKNNNDRRQQFTKPKEKNRVRKNNVDRFIYHTEDAESPKTPQRMFRQDWIRLKNNPEEQEKGKSNIKNSGAKTAKVVEMEIPAEAFPPQKLDCFVACLPGLEPILAQELKELGIDCSVDAGGVIPTTPVTTELLLLIHLKVGTASHVLVRCGESFVARGLPELRRKVSKLPWYEFLTKGGPLKVQVTSKKSKLNHNTAIRTAVLDGINKAFERVNQNKSVHVATEDSENPIRMVVRVERDEVTLSIDSSDTPIYKRGYRLETAKAPLREDIAYAMLYSAGWKANKYKSFLDPFCGSGTLAIEAAAMHAGFPPGRLRSAPFQGTRLFEPKLWRQKMGKLLRSAKRKQQQEANEKRKQLVIAASDRDQGAVASAKANAERAGVEEYINFDCISFSKHPLLQQPTESDSPGSTYPLLVVTNPPFNKRIVADKNSSLLSMYQTLMERQRLLNDESTQTVSSIVLLQDVKLFRKTGAKFEVKFSAPHGGIPVAAVFTDGKA